MPFIGNLKKIKERQFFYDEYEPGKKGYNPSLFCNGFLISRTSRKRDFLLPGIDKLRYIHIPDMQIIDIYNQLPLNLNRNQIDRNVIYEFEPELASEVFIDIMCQLMAIDTDSLFIEPLISHMNFHLEGFSIQSSYLNNYIKEEKIIIVDMKNVRNEMQRNILNEWIEMCKNQQKTGYVIRFGHYYYDGRNYYERIDQILHDKELLDSKIFNGMANIRFFERQKKEFSIPKTFIDDLFEKYMGKDPVVPYEMEERKKKFPSLFQDYSEIIEQYI